MKRLFLVIELLILVLLAEGQPNFSFDPTSRSAYEKITAFQFDEARKIIALAKSSDPDNNIPYWLDNNIDFLILLNSDDKKAYEALKENKKARIERLENGDKQSPYYRYCLADVYLQWAFCEGKFSEHLSAVADMRRAHNLFIENQKLYPDFPPNLVGLGVIHTLIGAIPEELQWIRKILGYKGSVDVGLDELRMAYQYSISKPEFNFLEQESLFFLSFLTVMLNTEKDKTTDFVDSYLKSKKSDGRNLEPLQAYSMARLLLFTGRNDDAIKIIRSYRKGQIPIYYLDYMLGTAYLNKLSDSCLIYYNQYLRSYKGNFYIKSTIQKMAWYYLLTGSETMYRQTLNRIASYPDSKSEPDQTAEKELKTGVAPNVLLLKARLLSDGGYYKLALKVMLSTRQDECCMDAKSSIEYSYRLGRIYEETARREVAIDQFKYTYTKGKEYPYYFAANSCIQIGKLYEEAGNYPEAEKWYQNCLDLNFTEYRKSLRYKAEFNLKRIRNRITQ